MSDKRDELVEILVRCFSECYTEKDKDGHIVYIDGHPDLKWLVEAILEWHEKLH
jgi:predicted alpha/beta-fold hydrolase